MVIVTTYSNNYLDGKILHDLPETRYHVLGIEV